MQEDTIFTPTSLVPNLFSQKSAKITTTFYSQQNCVKGPKDPKSANKAVK